MDFKTLEQILAKIAQKPEWETYRQHKQVLECWQEIVAGNISQHTRPLYISRQVLWVATSSSARAQELSFQRYTLLKKLNAKLSFKLADIRFSVANWQNISQEVKIERLQTNESQIQQIPTKNRPFNRDEKKQEREKSTPQLDLPKQPQRPSRSEDSQAALHSWLNRIKQRSDNYLPCPKCAAPTPLNELKRWGLCYHCIANKWSSEYRL